MNRNLFTSGTLLIVASLVSFTTSCDLEQFFNGRQVSIERSVASSEIVFRGVTVAQTNAVGTPSDVFVAYFDLVNTYKGDMTLSSWSPANDYSWVNVTFLTRPSPECVGGSEIPREYIIFCDLVNGEIRATSVARWDDTTDQRVWSALEKWSNIPQEYIQTPIREMPRSMEACFRVKGWENWSEWSSCSVSCSLGIQQRVRHCRVSKCPGFNVEQRHCNLFGCDETVNPLALQERKFFHPSKDRWQSVPDRPSAWRLRPNSYIWVPSAQLFRQEKNRPFPREFALFLTMRLHNSTMGTVFSLRSRRRQDTYLSLEVAGPDLKLIHASANGTDVVRIPADLDDRHWHQIAISIRDDSVVNSYVDCEWSRTDILRSHTLDIPDDSDLIIGYLFTGDLEQLSIVPDPALVSLQCDTLKIPIIDPQVDASIDNLQKETGKHIVMKIHEEEQKNDID